MNKLILGYTKGSKLEKYIFCVFLIYEITWIEGLKNVVEPIISRCFEFAQNISDKFSQMAYKGVVLH